MSEEVLKVASPATSTSATAPAALSPVAVEVVAAPLPAPTAQEAKSAAVDSSAVPPAVAVVDKKADVKTDAEKSSTLLGAEPAKATDKSNKDATVEASKAPDTNKEDGGQSEKTAQSPSYEVFKLPDGVTFDNEKLSEFTKELSELQTTTKAEQAVMQAFGQKLMDRHVAELQNAVNLAHEQAKSAEKAKVDGWKADFEKSPDRDTSLSSAGKAVSLLPEGMQKEFRQFLNETGVGNNPLLIRILAHYDKIISEYQKKYESESNIKPLVPTVPIEKPKGMANKMYGTMNNK